ncbi:hypothetical protein [Streptomyces sp. H27-C3]|uniref:hypothetical protein n=1 Tax=Streptomyces sp. H27-C3 TaxID=3046305 RepID=UPI0024B98E9C|nr:hypothetical protein [Streptomyces sp. H27-C3]MDJ0464523.1 hypothetical protein [Streptomyces sp. H27-C3]
MGALRRIRHRHTLAAIGLAGAAVVAVPACEPGVDGMSSVAVAMTTDQTGTRTLERAGVDVRWMSCTATVGEGRRVDTSTTAPTSSARSVASVKCEGETKGGQEIRIEGKVTEERDGRCVRGDLTARVGTKTVFQANVLGNCEAAPTTRNPTPPITYEPTRTSAPPTTTPAPRPPSDDQPRPSVTVTTTVTADPEPTCDCPSTK